MWENLHAFGNKRVLFATAGSYSLVCLKSTRKNPEEASPGQTGLVVWMERSDPVGRKVTVLGCPFDSPEERGRLIER
jgi:hypothetical protein